MRNNPIALAIDDTLPSVIADKNKRTLQGFMSFATHAVELEKFQRIHLCAMLEALNSDDDDAMPQRLYSTIAMAFWLGFETGKSYVINGHVDQMLQLEDKWNNRHFGNASTSLSKTNGSTPET